MFRSRRRQAAQQRWARVRAEGRGLGGRMRGNTGDAEYRGRDNMGGRTYEEVAGSADGLGYTHYDVNYKVQRAVDAKRARQPVGSRIEVIVNPANHAQGFFVERELPARA